MLDVGTTDTTEMLSKFRWFNKPEVEKTKKLLKENQLYQFNFKTPDFFISLQDGKTG